MNFFEELVANDDRHQYVWLIADKDTPSSLLTREPIGYAWLDSVELQHHVKTHFPLVLDRIEQEGLAWLQETLPYSQRQAEACAERFPKELHAAILRQLERSADPHAFKAAHEWLVQEGRSLDALEKNYMEMCPLSTSMPLAC